MLPGQMDLPLGYVDVGSLRWDPEPDITVYELAVALKFCMPMRPALTAEQIWDSLPDPVRRHFKYHLCRA